MESPSSEINPLDSLAEEFVERHRRGEKPTLDEYTAKHPELAAEIRDLFPALVMMEEVRPDKGDATGAFSDGTDGERVEGRRLERLGDYRILREVGRGGMGIVYEAEQESLGRHVALKVLPAHALLDPQRLRRFNREAKAAARLHHTNIVPVYGVGESDGLHYYVMQFIQGLGLDQVLAELRRLRRSKTAATVPAEPSSRLLRAGDVSAADVARSLLTGRFQATGPASGLEDAADLAAPTLPLPSNPSLKSDSSSTIHLPGQSEHSSLSETGRQYFQSVARIGVQVAEALTYANAQGTLHRDIKPSNLLLDTQGTVWVADFGLAKAADSEDLTHAGDIVGTIRYMAPERFRGHADARGDLYSLGLTLYELLTLRPAFEESDRNNLISIVAHETPPPPRKLNPHVPRDLETIVLKAITRDPSHRYTTPAEMAADLRRYLEDKPIRARRVSAAERAWRWCRRNPALASLTAAVLLLLCAGAVGGTIAAYHFSRMASEAKRLEVDALEAKRDAEDLARKMSDDLDRLNSANALVDSGGMKSVDGHWDEALADYTRATELRPDVAAVWLYRANFYMQFYQWENAAEDYAEGFRIQPSVDPSVWQNQAALFLYRGDVDGYREVCQGMLERFGQATDPKTVDLLARTCSLAPDAVSDWARLVQMMEKIVTDNPDNLVYLSDLAGVLLRSGQPEAAVRRYEAFMHRHKDQGLAFDLFGQCVLALAYQQIGKPDKANEMVTYVNNMLDGQYASVWQYGFDSPPQTYFPMYDPLVCVLRREVRKRLPESAAPEEALVHWLARSRGHAVLKQWERAAAELERAVASAPDDYQLRTERGRLYVGQKRWDQAAADFAEAIRQHPTDARVWVERGRMFALQERWHEAAADFHEAIDKPENTVITDPTGMGGQVLNVRSEILQWPPVFAELTRLRPSDAELWIERARNFNQKGKTADALAAFAKAIEMQPDNINYYWERGGFHVQESQWDPAAADYVKILDLAAEKPDLASWKQNALNQIAQNDKMLTKALELKPENLDLLIARGNWHAARNEAEPALRDYARVLDKAPDRNAARLDRGRLYIRLGRWTEATADFTKALSEGPLYDDWFQLAALHLLTGNIKEYEEHCRKTIKLHGETKDRPVGTLGGFPGGGPGGVPGGGVQVWEMDFHAGRILSVGSAEKELREQGAKWAEQAVAAAPTLPQCLHVLALAHYRAGKYEQAVQRLKESRKAAPDWGGPLNPLLLALCYQALKHPDEAEVERHNADVWLEKTNLPRPAAEAELPPPTLALADWLEYQLLRREVKRVFAAVNP